MKFTALDWVLLAILILCVIGLAPTVYHQLIP